MATKKVYGFNEDGFRRVVEATRRVLGTPTKGSQQRRQPPVGLGDGGGGCDSRNCKIQVLIFGMVTGGTFDMVLTINSTTETLTFNWDDTITDVATELATHTQLSSSDITVTGFSFPNGTMEIEFIGTYATTPIDLPLTDWSLLTGGTGTGIICMYSQLGHA